MPNLIIGTAGALRDFARIFLAVEQGWPLGAPRPYYLAWERDSNLQANAAFNMRDQAAVPAYRRILIYDYLRSKDAEEVLTFVQAKAKSLKGAELNLHAELAYDCTMTFAYALYAARNNGQTEPEDVTVAGFRDAMRRVTSLGAEPHLLSEEPKRVFTALGSGAPIHLVGASGELDFGTTNFAPVADAELWCFTPNPDVTTVVDYKRAGVTFPASGGSAQGSFSCPGW